MVPAVQKRSQATEERILASAERLVEQLPVEAVSIVAIARAAGVSVGGVYARFESKDALLLALHRRYESYRTAFMRDRLDPSRWKGADLETCVLAVCGAWVDLMLERRGVLRSFLLYHWSQPFEQATPFTKRLDDIYRTSIEIVLIDRDAIAAPDPERAARTAIAVMAGACRDIIVMKPAGAPGAADVSTAELINALAGAVLGILRRER